jgi:hypothetical protein
MPAAASASVDPTVYALQAPVPSESWIQATLSAPNRELLWDAGTGIRFKASQFAPHCDLVACTGAGNDITRYFGAGLVDTGKHEEAEHH